MIEPQPPGPLTSPWGSDYPATKPLAEDTSVCPAPGCPPCSESCTLPPEWRLKPSGTEGGSA